MAVVVTRYVQAACTRTAAVHPGRARFYLVQFAAEALEYGVGCRRVGTEHADAEMRLQTTRMLMVGLDLCLPPRPANQMRQIDRRGVPAMFGLMGVNFEAKKMFCPPSLALHKFIPMVFGWRVNLPL